MATHRKIYLGKHDWTSLQIAQLRALWATDLTAREIADRLRAEFNFHVTDNAVIGKCRRENFPERRPSPRRRA